MLSVPPTKEGGEGGESLVWLLCACFFINNVRNWDSGGIIVSRIPALSPLAQGRGAPSHLWRTPPRLCHKPCSGDKAVITTTLTATVYLPDLPQTAPPGPFSPHCSLGTRPSPSHVTRDRRDTQHTCYPLLTEPESTEAPRLSAPHSSHADPRDSRLKKPDLNYCYSHSS